MTATLAAGVTASIVGDGNDYYGGCNKPYSLWWYVGSTLVLYGEMATTILWSGDSNRKSIWPLSVRMALFASMSGYGNDGSTLWWGMAMTASIVGMAADSLSGEKLATTISRVGMA